MTILYILGVPVPQNVSEINIITSKANWVLIIEKDAAFQKFLDSDGLSRLGPVIFITVKSVCFFGILNYIDYQEMG